jgi:serine/threonine protein kinase
MSGTPQGSRVGTQFGPYHLKRLIGAGGFGEVYEAEDTVKDRTVALKLMREGLSKDSVFRTRMRREAHAAGRLQEPHVVPIHDYGEIDGLLYVDMRLIDGVDLHTMIVDEGPLSPSRAVAIVRQIAAALDAAHEAEVLHRDVKPENILITGDDFAYLVDFGLATAVSDERLTQMGTMVGTFSYMAPERFRNKDLTHKADIYSLACVLHECLTGLRPYQANSLGALITQHLTAPIPRPSEKMAEISPAFDRVIERGMAKEPDDRYATAGDLANAAHDALTATDKRRVVRILEDATQPTSPVGPPAAPSYAPPPPTGGGSTMGSGPMQRYDWTANPGNYGSGPMPSTPSQWASSPHQTASAPNRSKRPWVIGGAVGAALAVLVAIIVVVAMVIPGGGSGPTTTTTTTSTIPPGTYTQADETLVGNFAAAGYSKSNCTPQHPPKDDASSTLECDPLDGGPDQATFWLYPDQGSLDEGFNKVAATVTMATCPDGIQSPGNWHYTNDPTKIAGQLACGTDGDQAVVIWTESKKDFIALVRGPLLSDVYTWWQKKS